MKKKYLFGSLLIINTLGFAQTSDSLNIKKLDEVIITANKKKRTLLK